MTHLLHLRLEHHDGIPVLHVRGDLDLFSASDLRSRGCALVDAAFRAPTQGQVNGRRADVGQADVRQAGPSGVGPGGHHRISHAFVLDASGVTFIDSAGLGAVICVLKCVRAYRAGLSIAGSNEQLRHLLARTGLDKVIALHATAQEAADAATGPEEAREPPLM